MEIISLSYQSAQLAYQDISYELSGLIDSDSFFYGLFDYQKKLLKADRIDQSQLSDELAAYASSRQRLAIASSSFSVVPAHEYSSAMGASLLGHVTHIDEDHVIVRNDYSSRYDVRVVYAIDRDQIQSMQTRFDQLSMMHYITVMLESCDIKDSGISASLIGERLYIIAVRGEQLLMANAYEVHSDYDVLYFLQLVYQRLELDANSALRLSGEFHKDFVEQYINTYFAEVQYDTSDMGLADQQHSSIYSPLYHVSQCV